MSGRTGGVRVDVCRRASANAQRAVSNAKARIAGYMRYEGGERSPEVVTSTVPLPYYSRMAVPDQ